ncbi:unnamed protein product [Dibothriocephalus latus]|uniref:Peptidase S1 domain-containing protein n=1 Tax=Dibothriocephalus latus TaxID=60516 RepID=A0A3P7LWM2_DIBLA|nr:unnamed protein product [Dibothriocephalus latus]
MWFTTYAIGGCYLYVAILVQQLVHPQECGRRSTYHIQEARLQNKKTEAYPNSWPWHVGVYSSAIGPSPFCGETLIASKWVLTAAHCILAALECNDAPVGRLFSYHDITGEHMAVTVADHNYTQRQRPAYNVRVEGVIMHPSFTKQISNRAFDIALLQLNHEVKRTSVAEYACLPEPWLNLPAGYFCKFAGWGRKPHPPHESQSDYPETLMELRTQIVSTSHCNSEIVGFDDIDAVFTDQAQGSPYTGDSGGGLHCLTPDESKWVIYGVLSTGTPDCTDGVDVYALTSTKLSWINGVMTAHS